MCIRMLTRAASERILHVGTERILQTKRGEDRQNSEREITRKRVGCNEISGFAFAVRSSSLYKFGNKMEYTNLKERENSQFLKRNVETYTMQRN